MRIAVVTEAFHPAVDADTAMVKQLVDRYVDAGHRVLLVTAAPGLASYRGGRVARVRLGDLGGSLSAAAHVGDELDAFEPDVVEVHSPGRLGARALAEAAALGLPTLVVQSVPVASVDRWRRATASADRVVATSTWLARSLGSVDGVWRPGVDLAGFGPRLRSPHLHHHWTRPTVRATAPLVAVGHVGDLTGRGVRRLTELRVPGTRTVIVGDGPGRAALRRRLPEARLSTHLSRSELAVLLASLDVLVETAPAASSGALLREAAASGVPVVTVAGGGAEEVVEHGGTGLVVPDRPGALAAAVRTLAHDPARRAVLGHQARAWAEQRDWAVAGAELDRLAMATARRTLPRRRTALLSG